MTMSNERSRSEPTERIRLLKTTPQKDYSCKVRKPSRCRQYTVLLACLVLQILAVGLGAGISVLYVEVIKRFESPRSEAALIQSVYTGVSVGIGILGGGVLNKYGPGPCIMVGAVTSCVGLALSSVAVNVVMMIIFTGLIGGIGMSMSYLGSFVTVGWIFHDDAGVPLISLTIGSSLGQFIIPSISEALVERYGLNGAFLILGSIALHAAVCGSVIYTSRIYFKTGNDVTADRKRFFDPQLLKDPALLVILLCSLLLAFTGNSEVYFMADIMVMRGFERSVGSLFVSLVGLGNVCGRIVGAMLRVFCKVPTIYHWAYLGLMIGASHLFVIRVSSYWSSFSLVLVFGLCFGVTVAQTPAIVYEATGVERYPQAIALLNLLYGIGAFFCGFTGGYINDATGSYDPMFYLAVGCSLFVSVATVTMLAALRLTGSARFSAKRKSKKPFTSLDDST